MGANLQRPRRDWGVLGPGEQSKNVCGSRDPRLLWFVGVLKVCSRRSSPDYFNTVSTPLMTAISYVKRRFAQPYWPIFVPVRHGLVRLTDIEEVPHIFVMTSRSFVDAAGLRRYAEWFTHTWALAPFNCGLRAALPLPPTPLYFCEHLTNSSSKLFGLGYLLDHV